MAEIRKEIAEIDKQHLIILRKNVTRFMMFSGREYDRTGLKLLDIAPQNHEGAVPYFPKSTIETLDIDPKSNATYIADLCANNSDILPQNHFDIVICTEVLEHTLNPFNAVDEIYRILKKDGIVLVSVPFNFRIHGPLPDCWRISEYGLKSIFSKKRGFDIIDIQTLEDERRFLMPIHYTLTAKKR